MGWDGHRKQKLAQIFNSISYCFSTTLVGALKKTSMQCLKHFNLSLKNVETFQRKEYVGINFNFNFAF